jgi:hypothetical protein
MPRKDPEARKAYQKAYAQRNREKAYERVKAWRLENPEKHAEHHRRYAQKHPEKAVEKTLRWKLKNPERAAEVSRATRLKNKDRVVANKAIYRARKTQRVPTWLSPFDKLKIRCIYAIARMLTRENGEPWHVDHIIPLHGKTVSGLHVPSNLQILRAKDNHLKNNRFEAGHV